MTLIAIFLVVLSACVHASWNLLTKRRRPTASFFLLASLTGAVLLSPVLFLHSDTVLKHIPNVVWLHLITSGFCLALYYVSLASAYRAGDLSIAYPIVRAVPVVIVLVVVVILGRSDQVSLQSVFGALLVVVGCFMVPLQRFSELRLKNYLNLTCIMALIAALGTAGYSMVDDEALRYLRNDTNLTIDNTSLTLLYAGLEAFITSTWMALFVLLNKKSRLDFYQVIRINKFHAIVAGIGIHLSYTLVLIAFAFAQNVSYIVAFHRLSIPLGASLGVLILKEVPYRPKLIGILVVLVGLVFVAIG
jgi:drug/metabolite transporter (DMT)-like permease